MGFLYPEYYDNTGAVGSSTNMTTSEGLPLERANQRAILELLGAQPNTITTILDGSITPTSAVVTLKTEGEAPADDLITINATISEEHKIHDGMLLLLYSIAGSTVTVKHTTSENGILLSGGVDLVLSETGLLLQYDKATTTWKELQLGVKLSDAVDSESSSTGASSKAVKMINDKVEAMPAPDDDTIIREGSAFKVNLERVASTNLDNLTAEGKSAIAQALAMDGSRYYSYTMTPQAEYEMPQDSWVTISYSGLAPTECAVLSVDGSDFRIGSTIRSDASASAVNVGLSGPYLVKKGSICKVRRYVVTDNSMNDIFITAIVNIYPINEV